MPYSSWRWVAANGADLMMMHRIGSEMLITRDPRKERGERESGRENKGPESDVYVSS